MIYNLVHISLGKFTTKYDLKLNKIKNSKKKKEN